MEKLKAIIEEIKNTEVSNISLENIVKCKEIINSKLIEIDEIEGIEIINSNIKNRFGFKADIVKALIKHYKDLKKNTSAKQLLESKIDLDSYQEQILKELEEESNELSVNPVQDFVDGDMIYTFFRGGTPYIITSSKNVFRFEDAEQFEIILRNQDVSISNFLPSSALAYINGRTANAYECYAKIKEHIKRFIIFQDHTLYDFLTIWTIGTYMYRLFRYYPYIWINADKGSGKTKVMEVISPLAFNSIITANQTQASIFRTVDADGSTLFIDEFEKMPPDVQMGILTILNSGFNVDSGKTIRMEKAGDSYKRRTFNSYSPKVFAGISNISDVLQDRCVKIKMLKKSKEEHVERYKVDDELNKYMTDLRDELYILGLQYSKEIKEMYDSNMIDFPTELSDRECDIWEVIFILAIFLDKYCKLGLYEKMREYAISSSKERSKENIESNASYKIISSMLETVPKLKPVREEKNLNYYSSDEVFNKLKSLEEFDWLTEKKKLTSELKSRFQINCDRFTVGGKKIRAYAIPNGFLSELAERYNITNIIDNDILEA